MPADDGTYFNLKRLHVVFALSALALAAATVWMIVSDHHRPWKAVQRKYRDRVEPWLAGVEACQAQADLGKGIPPAPTSVAEPTWARRCLRWPVVDAWGSDLAIRQVWLPNLTLDYNFRQVPRFDRCMTCHVGADRTVPHGWPAAAIGTSRQRELLLPTPRSAPAADAGLSATWGLVLGAGPLHRSVAVAAVVPRSLAADARFEPGDRIRSVSGSPVENAEQVGAALSRHTAWGKPVAVLVERGLPPPYAAHPRPELFVTAGSPHPADDFGCTICHDGQGSATDFRWASHSPNDPAQQARWREQFGWSANPHWDLPMLPARLVEARCLKCHHQVTDLDASRKFPTPPAGKLMAGYHLVRQLGCFGCHEINGRDESGRSVGPDMRLEPAGTLRKVGPALTSVAGRLDPAFVADFSADPTRFRPTSRMPKLFGLNEHLEPPAQERNDRLEAVERSAIAAYFASVSQPVAPLNPPAGPIEPASAERGKQFFATRGCLACHSHRALPEGKSVQGPDLSRLGAKYTSESARTWLTSWIRDPLRHSPRTRMPSPQLVVEKATGVERPVDPAADIAAFLLADADWKPSPLPTVLPDDLRSLVVEHLRATFNADEANRFAEQGATAEAAARQADAALLVGSPSDEKRLLYVGRRTLRKRGCAGCHEVPGLHDASLIGPALSDWGRKQTSLLAFEQSDRFVATRGAALASHFDASAGADAESRREFFTESLKSHRREGFAWQKLGSPRGFDFAVGDAKPFNEQLRMGRFELSDAQREAIVTFLLGLVADPPAARYVYQPDRRSAAVAAGKKVLDTFGCAECHALELDRWTMEFELDKLKMPPAAADFEFLRPQFTAAEVAASKQLDRRGLGHIELYGMPRVDVRGNWQQDEDDDGHEVYGFTLWEPALIDGRAWTVGGADVLVAKHRLQTVRPASSGAYARLLYPRVVAEAKAAGAAPAGSEAWGWVPPSLVHTGKKLQPAWLYRYLRSPSEVRPASTLRMPKFDLSPAEATTLVEYLAASAGGEFPYAGDGGSNNSAVEIPPQVQARRDAAFRLMLDRTTFCAKCHLIGDYGPGGDNRTVLAPRLDQAGGRLQPDYLRRWLANPKSVLPYTAMPVNFPPGERLGQELLPGTSQEQLDAVVDVVVNYQTYLSRRTSVRQLAEPVRSKP